MFNFNHLKEVDQNYFQHVCFAMAISIRLSLTVLLLPVHALLPFVKMPQKFNVEGASDYLFDKDNEVRVRMMMAMDKNVSNTK
jgi:hypothetical protein